VTVSLVTMATMDSVSTASAGAIGGSSNEKGAELRARVGALLATCVIRSEPLSVVGLEVPGVPVAMQAEGDDPVDDLVIEMLSGARAFVQSKLRLTLGRRDELGGAARQLARAMKQGLTPEDRVVLVAAEMTKGLLLLREMLQRERHARHGARSGPEAREARRLEAILAKHLQPEAVQQLLRHLVIWRVDPREGADHALLVSRLNRALVAPGDAEDAAGQLSDEVRRLARLRAGHDSAGFLACLARRGIALASGPDAADAARQANALVAYRDRCVRQGSTLRLFGVPGELADIPLVDADAGVRVNVGDEDRDRSGEDLPPAVRRRGRVCLVGAGGSGKSTAIRSLSAHWASRSAWPLPISAHCPELAAGGADLTATLLAVASRHVTDDHGRTLLRQALRHALTTGECLILLDGFDEIRVGRSGFAERLRVWLKDLPASCELVIATRAVAEEEIRALGLRSLALRAPDRPHDTVEAILTAAAAAVNTPDREAWIRARSEWVHAALERDGLMSNTPLTVALLSVTAARAQDTTSLPRTRAETLKRALMDTLDDWEIGFRRDGALSIGGLRESQGRVALREALWVLASAALAPELLDRSQITRLLAAKFTEGFNLHSGAAEAAAVDALEFWEATGLFDFASGVLEARVRPLAELSVAWQSSEREPEALEAWVIEARKEEASWPILSLAAGLAPGVVELWAEGLAAAASVGELAVLAEAAADGAVISEAGLSPVVAGAPRRLLEDGKSAERAVRPLLKLPFSTEQRSVLRPNMSAHVAEMRRTIIEAAVTVAWDEHDSDADGRVRAVAEMDEPPPLDEPPPKGVLWIPMRDEFYMETLYAASERLAGGSRRDAELAIKRVGDGGSLQFRSQLRAALRAAGHTDLVEKVKGLPTMNWGFDAGDFDEAERTLLEGAAALASPAPLTGLQQRRLGELADLWATAQLNWVFPKLVQSRPQQIQDWIADAAELAGLDLPACAGQARQLLDEIADGRVESSMLLYDDSQERPMTAWEDVEHPAAVAERLVALIGAGPRQIAISAAVALEIAPAGLPIAQLLQARLDRLRRWSRWLVAHLLLGRSPEARDLAAEWLELTDPRLRSAAAEYWSHALLRDPSALPHVLSALADTDRGVQADMLQGLIRATRTKPLQEVGEVIDAVDALRAAPAVRWVCTQCDHENPPDQHACKECHTTGPEVIRLADELFTLLSTPAGGAS
jgi:hypothetical protein